nr:MAG TPA: Kruppel-like factor 3 finger, kruppel-like, DNA BINDING [Bacteriophage sp.]
MHQSVMIKPYHCAICDLTVFVFFNLATYINYSYIYISLQSNLCPQSGHHVNFSFGSSPVSVKNSIVI